MHSRKSYMVQLFRPLPWVSSTSCALRCLWLGGKRGTQRDARGRSQQCFARCVSSASDLQRLRTPRGVQKGRRVRSWLKQQLLLAWMAAPHTSSRNRCCLQTPSKRICHDFQCRYSLASAMSETPVVLHKGFHDRAHCAHRSRDHVRIRAQPGHASIPYPSTGTTCAPSGLMLGAAGLPT